MGAGDCIACGHANPADQRFCDWCGAGLNATCPSCGTAARPGARFCGSCGAQIGVEAAEERPSPVPVAERRLVSVLFADLVGFTAIAEARDAEEVRELLSRYFESCRRLIEVYGGTVEKFIGDAVMAVWGAPVATEQDAERAVRAGLDLVAAVSALGDELGVDGLRARVGVLTGEAAVTIGAVGQGMVAGDLVNTAARIQSVAEPGTVVVGDATRRTTEVAVVYEPMGTFELKGKEGETPLFKALRVVSGAQGSLRAERLEAPFVGRDSELRLVKETFHASAEERRAHLISVTGIGGIGKSRLAWEFEKYADGFAAEVYWHRGRCLAYGEGVAYWALADMVRMRCRIGEDEPAETVLAKLRATLAENVAVLGERERLEPRLAQLLGVGEHTTGERSELFAAWRLFFERLADRFPTVLVFEDMQWADASLLDFVEYLLDWSRNLPIFVVTLARPELLDKRPTWGAGARHFTAVYLDPLPGAAMAELLDGLVPGLPQPLVDKILDRAAGVPLYAVETVRMLLDRGVVVQEGPAYRLVGEVESLEVPETLHALIASRLDTLPADERRLLQNASILGKTFGADTLAALSTAEPATLEASLASLVRKEILAVQTDPRSPEHGQYGFLQDLVRHVAYETMSKRERRARHLAAADALAATVPEEEAAEVLAAHLAEAYALDPTGPDADAIRARARGALEHAADRAASLAAAAEASRYLARAAELSGDELERGDLELRAASFAITAGALAEAGSLLHRCLARFQAAGDRPRERRAVVQQAALDSVSGLAEAARTRLEAALADVDDGMLDITVTELEAMLGRTLALAGDPAAFVHLERAIDAAEALGLTSILANAMASKAIVTLERRPREALILLTGVLALTEEEGLQWDWLRTVNNLATMLIAFDRNEEALPRLQEGVARARDLGDREWETMLCGARLLPLTLLGHWDDAVAALAELQEITTGQALAESMALDVAEVYFARGEIEAARRLIEHDAPHAEVADDVQVRGSHTLARSLLARASGNGADWLAVGLEALEIVRRIGADAQFNRGLENVLEAALTLGEDGLVAELLEEIDAMPVGTRTSWLQATRARFEARARGDTSQFEVAERIFRERGMRFRLAVVLVEHAEALARAGGDDPAPLLDEAQAIFTELRAAPWHERAVAARELQRV